MKNSEFKKKVYDYLSQFSTTKAGIYIHNGKSYKKNYVLSLDETNQQQAIIDYALIGEAKEAPYKFGKLHPLAHHLNSSQIMCYNFFRPFLNKSADLNKLFSFLGTDITKELLINDATFEFEDDLDKFDKYQTSFDFHYGKKTNGIYCEIKYTEDKFGGCDEDSEHERKYKKYKELFNKCIALQTTNISFKNFCKYYQLYRNILRVKDKNCYSLFIIPSDAGYLKEEFYTFCGKFIKNEYIGKNVKMITWEEMIKYGENAGKKKHMVEFNKRYLMYK